MLGMLVLAWLKARASLLLCKVAQVSLRALGLCGMIGGFFCFLCFFECFSFVFNFSFVFVSFYTPCMLRNV